MPTQNSLSHDDDQPLSFWEHGPVREIVELEFDAALVREMQLSGVRVSPERERELRDAIVPQAFESATDLPNLRVNLCRLLSDHFLAA